LDTLNLGILAHVDAGKTSLTERLLYAAGVIDHVGRVDDGDTQTDTLALERRRGITIKSAVVSFEVDGTVVNLIDTPGHPDFIAEVERVGRQRRAAAAGAFAPPTLETVVVPDDRAAAPRLHQALTELAEQDPLINVRTAGSEIAVSLYGEVQKEVIEATLAEEYGLRVAFRETTTICIEQVVGTGEAVTTKDAEDNPFLAGVGLRIEPGPPGSGIAYARDGFVLGTMPAAFFTAVEDTVRATLAQGLYGWQVTDCRVTLTHTGYFPRQSHAHAHFDKSMSSTGTDFRQLTPLVLMAALRQAGTRVCEPVHRFRLELPAETLAATLAMLAEVQAVPYETMPQGASFVLEGDVPAAQVYPLTRLPPGVTHGEGVVDTSFHHYRPLSAVRPK
jgi:ribosomal protection tetracycline resistance protein